MFSKLFLALVAASCVVSNPVVAQHPRPRNGVISTSMPIKVHFDASGVKNFAQQERERVRYMAQKHAKRQTDVPVANAIVSYTTEVGVGNPPTKYNLIIDTGSSNTWIGANMTKPYVKTSTSKPTNDNVGVSYGSGQFMGSEFIDQVTLALGLVIKNQSIGVASFAQGFDGVDGILGVGPTDLTVGTLQQEASTAIPTVVDNLFKQKTIPTSELGVLFEPTNSSEFLLTGTLTFGGIDQDMLTSRVNYVPITKTSPASQFWGVDQSITYGNQSMPILKKTAGIVDTGTTLVLLATDAINAYQMITGAIPDQATGLLSITAAQMSKLESLFFHIGNSTYELTPDAQIFPPSLNSQIGGSPNSIYLVVADAGTSTGSGLDFINGFSFLQRFYSVYDTANSRVGFATTNFTKSTNN